MVVTYSKSTNLLDCSKFAFFDQYSDLEQDQADWYAWMAERIETFRDNPAMFKAEINGLLDYACLLSESDWREERAKAAFLEEELQQMFQKNL